jgi:hypothetical protein
MPALVTAPHKWGFNFRKDDLFPKDTLVKDNYYWTYIAHLLYRDIKPYETPHRGVSTNVNSHAEINIQN